MTTAKDVVDANGMKHDEKGLFSGYSGSAGHRSDYDKFHSIPHDKFFGISDFKSYAPKPPFRLPNVKTNGPEKQRYRYIDARGKEYNTRIDRITNRPVSDEMENAINQLYRGEEIPIDKIEQIPEIRRESKLADAYCTLDEIMHPEEYENRDGKINEIYRKFSSDTITQDTNDALNDGESYKVKQGKELWLVTGLPGSGKSTSFVGPISTQNQARVVDSDAIKEQMPGFCKGLGAPNVHEHSKSINDRILAESLKRGDNIVYPVLGYNATYVGDQIDSFRRHGYKVHLILNELPFSQALARCLERRLATGRNIPLAMFKKVGDRPSEAYEELKKQVDTFEKHSGDGVNTTLVERGENKNLPPPKKEIAYTYKGMPLSQYIGYGHDPYGNTTISKPHGKESVAKFADSFKMSPVERPKYVKSSWLDSFKRKFTHDAMDAADGVDSFPCDEFGNLIIGRIAAKPSKMTQDGSENTDAANDTFDIPVALNGEIEGYETAHDLARFHFATDNEFV